MNASSHQEFPQGHLCMSHDIQKTIEVQPLNLTHYAHDEGNAMVNQIVDPNHPLRDMQESQYRFWVR